MPAAADDPTVVHTVAVTVDDAVAAHEATLQRDADTVLRVTPPFSGRMRARLHRLDAAAEAASAVHVLPGDLFEAGAPSYPRPDETGAALREDDAVDYTRERHRQRHEVAVEDWRKEIRDHLVDSVPLRTPVGSHAVDVVALG